MTEPAGSNGRPDPVVKQLVAASMEEADRFTRGLVDRAREENAADAMAIERQWNALRASGLVGGGPINGRGPDPWAAGAREALADAGREFEAIGPYQPLEELGRGGQAVVYLAEDLRLHRPVALKLLKGLGPLSETLMNRFRREAEVASKLDHPGICAVYDAGVRDGTPYIAMRFVEGMTLAGRIEAAKEGGKDGVDAASLSVGSTTKPEIHRVLETIEKAARALHVAHEAGIVHRDVKPGNILVTPSGEPVLLDFGLAGDEDGGLMTLTETGDMPGTPAYMSPEQLMARQIRVDRRTDVYSLGVTLFECLTLERPFKVGTREAMVQAIQYKDPTDVRSLNPALPADLKVVIETALEKDRDQRYQTAEDLADDLRRVRTGEPISTRPISAAGRAWRWAKRRPMRASLLLALALGIPVLTTLIGHVIATRPAVLEAERQALLAEVERHLEQGYGELAHGGPERAMASFDAALALKADSGEAIGGKALALYRAGKPEACLAFLDTHETVEGADWALCRIRISALEKLGRMGEADDVERKTTARPETALGLFLAGTALMRGSERETDKAVFRAALDYFREAALRATHARPLYHFGLGDAAGPLGEEGPARRAAEALVALWPGSYRAHFTAGWALTHVDRAAAIAAYRKAIALKPDYVVAYNNLGCELRDEGQLDDAIGAYRKAIELKPDYAGAHHNLGLALRGKGALDEAIGAYRKAIGLKPDYADAHHNLGVVLEEKGELDEAILAIRKAIELEPDHARAHNSLGVAHRKKGELDEAILAFRKAIALKPDLTKAHCDLGFALWRKGQYVVAIEAYRKAIELKPDYPGAHYSLGVNLGEVGRREEAIAEYQKAIALKPDHAMAHNNLGNALAAGGKHEEAIAAVRRAIALKPDLAVAHRNLGILLAKRGELDAAIAALQEAIGLQPDCVGAYYDLGIVLCDRKRDYDGAIAANEKVIELEPDHARAHTNLGVALAGAGRTDEAIAAHHKAIELAPWLARAHYNLGCALFTKDEFDKAIAAFEKAIGLKPDYTWAYGRLGLALRKKGEFADAIAALRKMIALAPGDARGYRYLGLVLRDKGEHGEAVAAFRKAIELKPDYALAHCNLGRSYRDAGQLVLALEVLRRGHELGSTLAAKMLRDCEVAVLEEAHRLASTGLAGDDPKARVEAAEMLAALLDGWQGDMERGRRKPAIKPSLERLGRREPWGTLRDPRRRERLPPAERERWRRIWTVVDELAPWVTGKK